MILQLLYQTTYTLPAKLTNQRSDFSIWCCFQLENAYMPPVLKNGVIRVRNFHCKYDVCLPSTNSERPPSTTQTYSRALTARPLPQPYLTLFNKVCVGFPTKLVYIFQQSWHTLSNKVGIHFPTKLVYAFQQSRCTFSNKVGVRFPIKSAYAFQQSWYALSIKVGIHFPTMPVCIYVH